MNTQSPTPSPTRWRTRLLLGSLALLLLASLALHVRQTLRIRNLKTAIDLIRLDPLNLDTFAPARTQPAPLDPIVIYGDSRAHAWPAPASLPNCINRGIGSQTSEQALLRYPIDVAPLRPRILILQLGVNDLRLVAPFPERRAAILRRLKDNITRILELARAQNTTVILTTIVGVGDPSWKDWPQDTEAIRSAIREANDWLREVAGGLREATGVFMVDAAALVGPPGGLSLEFQRDPLHLNDAGYQRLNLALLQALEQHSLLSRPSTGTAPATAP